MELKERSCNVAVAIVLKVRETCSHLCQQDTFLFVDRLPLYMLDIRT